MQDKQDGEIVFSHTIEATGVAAAPAPATSLLVVEDDENISTAIKEYFSRAGYSVTTASDGVAGVEAAGKNRPDVVVLDLMLPKMDGLAVCKELRQSNPQMPIIMLTAKDDIVDKVLGLEMGADDYITKPFSLREVEARIKSVLRRARAATATATSDGKDETPIVRGHLRVDPGSTRSNNRRATRRTDSERIRPLAPVRVESRTRISAQVPARKNLGLFLRRLRSND